jgi:hypothetical protein
MDAMLSRDDVTALKTFTCRSKQSLGVLGCEGSYMLEIMVHLTPPNVWRRDAER